ncbi:aspartate kinase [Lentibacillus saliphilus]|uniref:aspartate kinase n=1 Tax=Lentibacillus saliphilus TaxID=2737028 RepID=UPI001C30B8C4|nr:aspartate kinase [Lentibacillus saliphilus]
MPIIVQKFGGTSVSTRNNRNYVINHIKEAIENGFQPVVVVSAMGRFPEPYATDTLLSLLDLPNSCSSPREKDLLMSCGETISAVILANEIRAQHISAVALTGGQGGLLTSDDFTRAKIKDVRPNRILKELHANDVVVVAGFQGITELGDTTTIGRGGSDTTAAALASALKAERIDIFTDVNGIMTADPRMVTSAQPLHHTTYIELCHMAYQGASVVHPRAVELAMQANIPMRITSTYSKASGTRVSHRRSKTKTDGSFDRPVTGIAHMQGLTQIKVNTKDTSRQSQSEVFKAMASAGISVDFINISTTEVVYTVPDVLADRALAQLNTLGFAATVHRECAKVSVVGAGMSGMPGIASKMIEALTDKGVRILQSADSHTTIWVLVAGSELPVAVNALHEAFDLGSSVLKTV